MARIIHIDSIADPAISMFTQLTERQLRNRLDPATALFIAESPKVITVALNAGYHPHAMLCEERHIEGDAANVIARCPADMPLYTGSRELLQSITGYTLTRGVLCAMERIPQPDLDTICHLGAKRLAVIHGVTDTTNIGAIFRSAAALGVDGVVLTTDSCDPLNRRSIRTSMGTVFQVPWTWLDGPITRLGDYGFRTVAMALTDRSVSIADPRLAAEPRLAIVLGTEGDGLPESVIAMADYTVRIPMSHSVDSLNVAAASAVAFWELRPR